MALSLRAEEAEEKDEEEEEEVVEASADSQPRLVDGRASEGGEMSERKKQSEEEEEGLAVAVERLSTEVYGRVSSAVKRAVLQVKAFSVQEVYFGVGEEAWREAWKTASPRKRRRT